MSFFITNKNRQVLFLCETNEQKCFTLITFCYMIILGETEMIEMFHITEATNGQYCILIK